VGCGTGRGLFFLHHIGVDEIYGIDVSDESIKICKENLNKAGCEAYLCTGSAENLPFRDEFFDLVTCFSSLHHVYDWKKALKEIYRVLEEGGECYCVFERRKRGIENFSRLIDLEKFEDTTLDIHQFTEEEIYEKAFSIGFEEIKIKEKDMIEFIYHKKIRKYIPTDSLKVLGYKISELIDETLRPVLKNYFVHLDIYLRK
jgi:ubiquinone/menaquinone biosynthesis C-methylase UbiE